MKRFNITDNLYYCQEKHTLCDKTGENLRLTYSQGKLFELIITNGRQQPVNKSLLIETIWGKAALFDFSPAINQKIYTLRKDLKRFHLENLIITVPRLGYKVNSDFIITETDNLAHAGGLWQTVKRFFAHF
ncbi:winged helix-turn-helix domain-containing protein [Rouxiella sp. T17]|uniref:winged helix-turn-helix domain-containing protein n=1 Tax=Rouxiella sp. T17 TaxID=3085684 RepID=UPI002FCA124E